MDMRKILQAMDGISTKPVEGVDSMAKFLRVVKEANLNQPAINEGKTSGPEYESQLKALQNLLSTEKEPWKQNLTKWRINNLQTNGLSSFKIDYSKNATGVTIPTKVVDSDTWVKKNPNLLKRLPREYQPPIAIHEGANPHKVALPVQMAMQHYQTSEKSVVRKDRLIDKYFTEAEVAITQRKEEKRANINQYASIIAERVMMKESKKTAEGTVPGHSMGFKPGAGPGLQPIEELSTELLGKYKKAAGSDAKAADAEGDFERGNKRFKGINKATVKQFDNDAKKHKEQDISEDNVAAPAPRISVDEAESQIKQLRSKAYEDLASMMWMAWPKILDTTFGTRTSQDKPATPDEIGRMLGYKLADYAEEYRQKVKAIKITAGVRDPQSLNKTSASVVVNEQQIDEEKQRLDPKCWKGKHKEGTKIKGGVRVNNCVPNKK